LLLSDRQRRTVRPIHDTILLIHLATSVICDIMGRV
jgi:hypothetical protein